MEEKIKKLKISFNELFDEDMYSNTYIEIKDNKEEIILKVNQEGLLLLVEELINLCDNNVIGSHYHLDEYGMADKCDKPMVITLLKTP